MLFHPAFAEVPNSWDLHQLFRTISKCSTTERSPCHDRGVAHRWRCPAHFGRHPAVQRHARSLFSQSNCVRCFSCPKGLGIPRQDENLCWLYFRIADSAAAQYLDINPRIPGNRGARTRNVNARDPPDLAMSKGLNQNNKRLWYPLIALPEILAVILYGAPRLDPRRGELSTISREFTFKFCYI